MNNNLSENELILLFLSEKKGINPKNAAKYLQGLDKQKQQDLAREYQLWKESKKKEQTKRIAHGAKLQYVKSLKHICPEGEELIYYKKGGSVTCGCKKKKKEQGEEIVKGESGIVSKFKRIVKKGIKKASDIGHAIALTDLNKKIHESEEAQKKVRESNKNIVLNNSSNTKEGWNKYGDYVIRKSEQDKREAQLKANKTKEETTPPNINRGIGKNACGSKMKKASCGCAVKKFKAKCGSKLKKHQLGGSLNGIPFMLEGTPKGGVNLNSSIPNRPQFFIPLKVKPTNWYGSNLQQVVVFDNDSGNLYKRTRKIANNGDTFEEDITTRPYPLSSDTSYAYTSKYNGIKLGSNTIKHVSPKLYLEYDSLKNAFRKIVSKPINGVPL